MSAGLSYAPYERAFLAPFSYGNRTLDSRNGFILRKETPAGVLYSEAAPLPGHSSESLEDVRRALSGSRETLPPSLSFAMEAFEALENPGMFPVRTNALLPWRDSATARAQLSTFERDGYSVCKLKMFPGSWESQLEVIEEFSSLKFRLDANLGLNADLLERIVTTLEKRSLLSRIDYFEEPFPGFWTSKSFAGCALAFAADESACSIEAALTLLDAPNAPAVFIVKPTVWGGLKSLENKIAPLREAKKRIIFTSTLETEPGRRSLIAHLSKEPHEICGLSTGHLFRENFLADAPVWNKVPAIGIEEQKFLGSLSWKGLT